MHRYFRDAQIFYICADILDVSKYFGYAQIFQDVHIYFEHEQIFWICADILDVHIYFDILCVS